MLGVFAQAASEHITADVAEISDAGWFDRPTIKAALARSSSKESPVLQAYDGGSGALHACMQPLQYIHTVV
jgi:NADH pyrophosphatase NudC (nudix superfamily)